MKALLPLVLIAAPAAAKTIDVAPGPNAQERLQTALIDAQPGDVIQLAAGRFVLSDGLSLDVAKVTVRGAGADKTVLDFKGQQGAGEGLLVTSSDVVLRDFAVEDAKGDAIKSKGVERTVYKNLRVEWTGGPKETNGAYGLYPVASKWVLIDGCIVKGASDAGIYVGQSQDIVVRNNVAQGNVAGIEIENSYRADVFHNVASHNTGGILVFDLPNLPQMGGHSIRVFENQVTQNDTPNFAPKGNIVASVPNGTGIMVMANRDVHVFKNALSDNATTNIMIVAYKRPFEDKTYDPLPHNVVVRQNAHGRAGWAPGFVGGKELAAAMGGALAPVFWDGAGGRERTNIVIDEMVPVVSLNLPEALTPVEQAKPGVVDLKSGKPVTEPAAVVLPASMEAAAR
ncbi:MAG TPA: parallel beta-helix domain-containing protein [Sphingomonas sp.]|jgi:parallel beta-helix repeat protein|nr:parallel beta-helix domain-containing protein [Sphingomonas sp.]